MKKQATYTVTIIIVLVTIANLATSPATKPSTAKTPAKNRVDADSIVYKCDKLGFSFSAPKAWTPLQNNPSVGRFELNMNAGEKPEKAGAKKSAPTHSNFEVNGGTPCHGDATLDGQAKAIPKGCCKSRAQSS